MRTKPVRIRREGKGRQRMHATDLECPVLYIALPSYIYNTGLRQSRERVELDHSLHPQ